PTRSWCVAAPPSRTRCGPGSETRSGSTAETSGSLAPSGRPRHYVRPFRDAWLPEVPLPMSFRDALSPVLRAEFATELTPHARAALETVAADADTAGQIVLLRDECAGRLKQPNASHGVEYLLAAACARHGEIERAMQTLLALGDKLAAEKEWEA